MHLINDLKQQIPAKIIVYSVFYMLTAAATTASVVLVSFFSDGFQIQYLIIGIIIAVLAGILFWIFHRFLSKESVRHGNNKYEMIICNDGRVYYEKNIEVIPICEDISVIKGQCNDWSVDWTAINVRPEYGQWHPIMEDPSRYIIWFDDPPKSKQSIKYAVTTEFRNTGKRPKPYNWVKVKKSTNSITLSVVTYEDVKIDSVHFVTKDNKGNIIKTELLKGVDSVETTYVKSMCDISKSNTALTTYRQNVLNPRRGWTYIIEWRWDDIV